MIRGASGDKYSASISTYDSEIKRPRKDTIDVVALAAKPAYHHRTASELSFGK